MSEALFTPCRAAITSTITNSTPTNVNHQKMAERQKTLDFSFPCFQQHQELNLQLGWHKVTDLQLSHAGFMDLQIYKNMRKKLVTLIDILQSPCSGPAGDLQWVSVLECQAQKDDQRATVLYLLARSETNDPCRSFGQVRVLLQVILRSGAG
jgi:hypothetical protein